MSSLAQGKRQDPAISQTGLIRAALLLSTILSGAMVVPAHAGDLPSNGVVAAGAASIVSGENAVTIDQSSARAVINWDAFSVGSGNRVDFHQPDAAAATLNRVTGGVTSQIAGEIRANGAVYLVNPNGIVISRTGEVNAAGGFVASTLDIADGDFMAGKASFTGNGSSAGVSNAGRISAGQGAYVALLGGSVSNSGYISVPLGKIGLGSGEQIALDINGDNFLQVAVPTSALTGDKALVDNSGTIVASGGAVLLKAATLKDAVRNVINMSGSISADSAVSDGGRILLLGGDGGTVKVSGSLSARATGASGDGGFIETSGKHVDLNGIAIDTSAANGLSGSWLIDPVNFTIAASGGDITGAQLSANLGGSNVTILSSSGAAGTDGDVLVNDAVSWSSGNTLTLSAYRSIAVNNNIAASGANAGLVLQADNTGTGIGTVTFGGGATASLTGAGSSARIYYNPVSFGTAGSFGAVTAGSVRAYQLVNTLANLQAINSFAMGNNYALGRDIDASATAAWNGGAGFVPIGTDGAGTVINGGNGFGGSFDGQGHTIANLTINRPSVGYVGLFGRTSPGSRFVNTMMTGADIRGDHFVAALVGYAYGSLIENSFAQGSVFGAAHNTGGLVGVVIYGTVSQSYAAVNVTGGDVLGGLMGQNYRSTITKSYATGNVSANNGIGGLVGYNWDGTITQSYATGNVSGNSDIGGLVGINNPINFSDPIHGSYSGYVSQSYATGNVSGTLRVGGLAGANYDSISQSYSTGIVSGSTSAGGLVGYNYSTISSSFWDKASSGLTAMCGSVGGTGCIDANGLTSAQARSAASYAGWDFANVWYQVGDMRPILRSEAASPVNGVIAIGNLHQLALVGANLGGSYVLAKDIDASETSGSNPSGIWSEQGFVPLGTNGAAQAPYDGVLNGGNGFNGSFDGQGHTISNLSINRPGADFVGLFGVLGLGHDVRNLGLANISVSGDWAVGGLAGFAGPLSGLSCLCGNIVTTSVTGDISGTGFVGGLVGVNFVNIADSFATASVTTAPSDYWNSVGGLAGANYGYIIRSYATGTVTGSSRVGGLAGSNQHGGSILYSYASGDVSGADYVGGLVGVSLDGSSTISQSYATGDVSGRYYVGGLMGLQDTAEDSITLSYAAGNVSGVERVGGLVGWSAGSIDRSLATGDVSASVQVAGGLVGQNYGAISQSYATGNVSAQYHIGGLVGHNDGPITQTYATGNVTGTQMLGGLVGTNDGSVYDATISDSYAMGNVSGTDQVGGLVGLSYYSSINRTYATGSVSGSTKVGGLIGDNVGSSSVSSSYWDQTTSGQTSMCGFAGGTGCTDSAGLTTAQMQEFATHAATYSGWDFANVWSPPSQAGQAGQTSGYYPQLYALTPVVVATPNSASRTYGAANPALSGSVTAGGPDKYVFGPEGDSLSVAGFFTTSATSASNAGSYSIDGASNSRTSTGGVAYRVIVPTNTALVVNPAALVITYTADLASRTYGAANPAFTGSAAASGLVNDDTFEGVTSGTASFSTTATSASNAGSYAINGSGLSGSSSNYTFSFQQAAGNATALTIDPASLVITYTANGASRTYGAANPAFSGSAAASGLVNDDTLAGVTSGSASFSTPATTASNVGSYAINGSGLSGSSSNYTYSFVQAASNATALVINPAALVITYTANLASRQVNQPNPLLTGTQSATGLVNGETLAGVTSGTAIYTTTATSLSGPGLYPVTGSGLSGSSANYTYSFVQAAGNATALKIIPASGCKNAKGKPCQ